MSHQPSLASRHRHLAVLIAVIGAFSVSSPLRVSAQVTWTVTVAFTTNVTTGEDHQTYSVSKGTTGVCNYGVPNDGGYHLRVCKGDKILWVVTTPSGQNWVRIFHQHAILDDTSGNKTHLFQAQNAAATGGKIDSSVKEDDFEEYEYCVAAYDITSQHLYLHDPRIIVGTGGRELPQELWKVLAGDADRLKQSLQNDPLDTAAVAEDLKKLDGVIRDLKDKLKVP